MPISSYDNYFTMYKCSVDKEKLVVCYSCSQILSTLLVDIVNSGRRLCTGPPAYIARRAGPTTLCQSRLYSPVRD